MWLIIIMVSAIVEVSLPRAAYFDRHQIGVKTDFFTQNHHLLSYFRYNHANNIGSVVEIQIWSYFNR